MLFRSGGEGLGELRLLHELRHALRYILNTIISNYSKDATVVISTHLIEDIEPVLDEAVFLKDGRIFAHRAVDDIRETEGKSVDAYFRAQ